MTNHPGPRVPPEKKKKKKLNSILSVNLNRIPFHCIIPNLMDLNGTGSKDRKSKEKEQNLSQIKF